MVTGRLDPAPGAMGLRSDGTLDLSDTIPTSDTAPSPATSPTTLGDESAPLSGEGKYRELFEQVRDAIYITRRDGTFIDINRSALELFGYAREEVLLLRANEIYVDDQARERFQAVVEEVGFVRDYEVKLRRKDGTIVDALLTSTVRRDLNGEPVGYYGIIHDITVWKEAELALRESEERYALAVRGANDGIWDWNIRTNTIYISPRWKAMLGIPESEVITDPELWFGRVHPDDREGLLAQVDEHRRGRIPHLEHEHRLLHENGTYLWVLSRGIAVRTADGTAYRMAGSLTDITSRKLTEERLLHGAFHDTLTGLPNRALFMDRLGHLVESARRRVDNLFAVLFLDLDHFKLVNDRLGHSAGDQLLTCIARLLEKCVRPGDTVARLGGDEFAVLLADITNVADATGIADRILKKLESPFRVGEQEVYTTASIGIAANLHGYERPDDLLRDADIALYRAKSLGRGQRKVFDMAIHAQAVARLELESDLGRAVENQELLLAFQPIVSLETGQIMAFEALIRWDHPVQGILLPKDFIQIAEETGLILPIGAWVLRQACTQLRHWLDLFPNETLLNIHINLSSKRFGRPGLVQEIESVLHETGLEASRLTLELGESVLMKDAENAIEICHQLKKMGARVCIDDFGTGYSSLSYLHRFPTDALKIDRSFISPINADGNNLELVRTIVALADNLGMDIIAEGIETPEQLAQLKALGCKIGQGYLIAGPVAPDAAADLIRDRALGARPA